MMRRNGAMPMKVVFAAMIIIVVTATVIAIFTGRLDVLGTASNQSNQNIDKTGDLADQIGSGDDSDADSPSCADRSGGWTCVPESSSGYCDNTDSSYSCPDTDDGDPQICCDPPF